VTLRVVAVVVVVVAAAAAAAAGVKFAREPSVTIFKQLKYLFAIDCWQVSISDFALSLWLIRHKATDTLII
jgi:hypothetical protein